MFGVIVDFCFSSLKTPLVSSTSTSAVALNLSPPTLRKVQGADLKEVTEVLATCFHPPDRWIYWLYPLLKLGIYEDLRSRLRQETPCYQCIVATYPDQPIVGTVEMSLRPSVGFSPSFPYISNLAVSPTYRRKGIARQLLGKCEQVTLEWGYDRLFLHVLDNNLAAKALYFSQGYQLHHVEWSLIDWLFHRSRRLLLYKQLNS